MHTYILYDKLFIKNLDKYEGYPYLYDKKEIEFELYGKKVKGLIYIMMNLIMYYQIIIILKGVK